MANGLNHSHTQILAGRCSCDLYEGSSNENSKSETQEGTSMKMTVQQSSNIFREKNFSEDECLGCCAL
jgi:hypothetical protein